MVTSLIFQIAIDCIRFLTFYLSTILFSLLFRVEYEEFGRRASAYDIKTEHLDLEKSYALRGYFQSWRYFDKIRPEIHKLFTFLPEIKSQALNFHQGTFIK